jgi:hypothetical protein
LQVGDTGPVESARRSNSRVLGSPFSGLSGQQFYYYNFVVCGGRHFVVIQIQEGTNFCLFEMLRAAKIFISRPEGQPHPQKEKSENYMFKCWMFSLGDWRLLL